MILSKCMAILCILYTVASTSATLSSCRHAAFFCIQIRTKNGECHGKKQQHSSSKLYLYPSLMPIMNAPVMIKEKTTTTTKDKTITTTPTTLVKMARSKWDDLVDEEDEEMERKNLPRDMRYIASNLLRQRNHFEAIRNIAGKDMISDVYVRDPKTTTWWFVGKVARVSDVPIEKAIARQWNLIEEHACNLRPFEILPIRKKVEIWVAPGDSELDVAYNRPNLQFTKMDCRSISSDLDEMKKVRNVEVGFEGEVYEQPEMAFRTERTEEGFAARPEVQAGGEKRTPTQEELEMMIKLFEEEQQQQSGGE